MALIYSLGSGVEAKKKTQADLSNRAPAKTLVEPSFATTASQTAFTISTFSVPVSLQKVFEFHYDGKELIVDVDFEFSNVVNSRSSSITLLMSPSVPPVNVTMKLPGISMPKLPNSLSLATDVDVLLDPNLLSDSQATKLGRKQYNHGDTNLAITTTATTAVISHGIFIPFELNDGDWRMSVNIEITHDTTSTHTVSISNTVFKNITGSQLLSSAASAVAINSEALATSNTGDLVISTSATSTVTRIIGEIALGSKPIWAI